MWYTFCNENNKRLTKLEPLEVEALKYNNFEDFKRDFLLELKHGRYWHITDNANFQIDTDYAPRDMSSLANGQGTNTGLMITSDLPHWAKYYRNRLYAAEIDMSNVPSSEYRQVKRGFGNEFWVTPQGAAKARVIKVYPIKSALRADSCYYNSMPSSEEQLLQVWEQAHAKNQIDDINIEENDAV